jgi:hypothetical protein
MQVEDAGDCLVCAWLEPPFSQVLRHHLHVFIQHSFYLGESIALGSKTNVIGIDEFACLSHWQIIDVDIE